MCFSSYYVYYGPKPYPTVMKVSIDLDRWSCNLTGYKGDKYAKVFPTKFTLTNQSKISPMNGGL